MPAVAHSQRARIKERLLSCRCSNLISHPFFPPVLVSRSFALRHLPSLLQWRCDFSCSQPPVNAQFTSPDLSPTLLLCNRIDHLALSFCSVCISDMSYCLDVCTWVIGHDWFLFFCQPVLSARQILITFAVRFVVTVMYARKLRPSSVAFLAESAWAASARGWPLNGWVSHRSPLATRLHSV